MKEEVLDFMQAHGLSGGDEASKIGTLIRDNMHLKQFLLAIRPQHRYQVLDTIKPHLRFKAKPFWWLIRY